MLSVVVAVVVAVDVAGCCYRLLSVDVVGCRRRLLSSVVVLVVFLWFNLYLYNSVGYVVE